jgi:hypothetical protein
MLAIRNRIFCISALALIVNAMSAVAEAEVGLRSSFPGRRVGGGTRGECSARTLAHLVPESSVFAPGAARTLGLVQGPTANPVSLKVIFKPNDGGIESVRTLAASPASIILLSSADVTGPTVWESSFTCESALDDDDLDPIAFVQTTSPPALSLLVSDPEASDQTLQMALKSLLSQCGSSVPSKDTMAEFGLADLVTDEWPDSLPVRCPA